MYCSVVVHVNVVQYSPKMKWSKKLNMLEYVQTFQNCAKTQYLSTFILLLSTCDYNTYNFYCPIYTILSTPQSILLQKSSDGVTYDDKKIIRIFTWTENRKLEIPTEAETLSKGKTKGQEEIVLG